MTDLKPCPFCGGEAMVKEAIAYAESVYTVGCGDSECMGYEGPWRRSKEDVIAAWNRRDERTCTPVNVDREDEDGRLHKMFHRCSECGHDLPYEADKGHGCYCPHCGAKVVS